ncbi:MAG: hypothetical protein EB060_12750 [Proteobacteria bacterium]|nr:hypothetical protein [Pseudomonadota bacterium]
MTLTLTIPAWRDPHGFDFWLNVMLFLISAAGYVCYLNMAPSKHADALGMTSFILILYAGGYGFVAFVRAQTWGKGGKGGVS